ncbi:unnamed protein product [Peronospora belbahrii]|uniref:Uncharacterized protein n=1 Tax=Peronospora belbahrii TaxID=622444 RepID=A0AAU9KJ62_9STRA|nr:unnamed protein product [Peronospora belbahrii]CAH0517633.1 unnamed protein product [Peronospora belbahrii]
MFPLVRMTEDAANIEHFRTLHRNLLRTKQYISTIEETLDENDGRKRKISINSCRNQQQQAQSNKLQDVDGSWSQSTGNRILAGLHTFNYATSSRVFQEPCNAVCNGAQHMADVAKQVASMGFHCASMW